MATKGEIGKFEEQVAREFCDDVYTDLEGMRLKLFALIDEMAVRYGEESPPFKMYKRHLQELVDQFEWKLQILSHVCPYEWKGSSRGVESIVSVRELEPATGTEFSGGYIGG